MMCHSKNGRVCEMCPQNLIITSCKCFDEYDAIYPLRWAISIHVLFFSKSRAVQFILTEKRIPRPPDW